LSKLTEQTVAKRRHLFEVTSVLSLLLSEVDDALANRDYARRFVSEGRVLFQSGFEHCEDRDSDEDLWDDVYNGMVGLRIQTERSKELIVEEIAKVRSVVTTSEYAKAVAEDSIRTALRERNSTQLIEKRSNDEWSLNIVESNRKKVIAVGTQVEITLATTLFGELVARYSSDHQIKEVVSLAEQQLLYFDKLKSVVERCLQLQRHYQTRCYFCPD
jgi:hypothetical protein